MANLKKEAKIVAKQDNQNFAVTVDTLQSFLRADPYTGSLIPKTDVAYDLGSPGTRWRDIYLDGNSLHLGGIVLSEDAQGKLHVENEENPTQEVSFDLSTSLIGDLKDVNTSGVTEGQILKWNPANQQWMASDEVSSSLKFHGVIGTEPGEILAPDGSETEGDFYLVHGTHQISGWAGIADNTEVTNQDMVVKGATDFSLLTGVIGGGGSGVTTIVSETEALVVDDTLPAAPKLSILNATETVDGLMAAEDKVRLGELSDGLSDVKFDSIEPLTVGDDFDVSDQNQVSIVKELNVADPSGVVFDWNRELNPDSYTPSDRIYSVVPADGGFGLGTVDKPFDYLYADLVNANKFDLRQYVNINPYLSSPFVKVTNYYPQDENGVSVNTENFGLEFSLDRGNTFKNQLKVTTRLGDIVKISGGTRPEINFGTNFKDGDIDLGNGKEQGVLIKGVITPNDTSSDTQVANKGYVDSKIIKADILSLGTYSTDLIINRYVDDAFLDRENNRILMWRNYFGQTGMNQQPHLIVADATTNQVEYKEVINPIAAGDRREAISCPFKIGDDQFFVQAENPKDSAPLKLDADGTFAEFGDLKMCQDWAIINYHVKLSDRYRLFVGNPQLRIDANYGNHSQQAQVTLLLDTEDLINQNEVESFTHSGDGQTYGTCTKRISNNRGGTPAVIDKGEGNIPDVYLLQTGKSSTIVKCDFNDLEAKDVTLTGVTNKLPVGYLVDHAGKFVSERGRLNGITVFQNRYIVFHALYDALYSFDTNDDSLTELVSMVNNTELGQWVKYGVNNQRLTPAAPNFDDKLYYFPHSAIGDDGIRNDPKLIIVHKDLTLEYVDIPYEDWECTNSQKVNEYEIVCTNKKDKVFVFDTRDNSFSRFTSYERLNTIYEALDAEGNTVHQILPYVDGNNADDTSFKDCNIQEITKVVDPEYIANLDLLRNNIIKNHDEAIQALNHNDSLISTRDGLSDIIHPEVHLATEDESYVMTNLMEHCSPCWPDEDHKYYQLISQDYVLFHRMYEGSKKTEDDDGNVVSNNETLDSDDYGNDDISNLMIFHIPTGKIKDISVLVSHNDSAVDIDGNPKNKFPSLRGKTVIPRSNGDVDVYSWIHNPRRKGISQPLVRIHIPANPDPSNPFAGVTTNHTNIKCDLSLLTTPDANPYGNYVNTSKKYQYEISQFTWDLVDNETDERHHFIMSYNKGSKDYVTQRIFEINFDDSDPDEGTITPVAAHAASSNESFAAGIPVIKKDITGKNRCFLYGSPCALTELYFTGDDLLHRTVEMRNYADYTPQGIKRFHEEYVNGMGQQVIKEKGIYDNWYKSSTLSPQFLTQAPIDNNDYFTNIIVWYQGAYGVCSLNIQDLGVLDRQAETKFENNYQGSEDELSSMFSETKNTYLSYLQEGGSRNLHRFSTKLLDTHSHGKLYYFPYRADYVYDIKDDGSGINGNRTTLYNSTRKFDTDGNVIEEMLYKRSILEVSPNYVTGLVEIRAIVTSKKHFPSGNEPENPEGFSGESVVKFGDVFVCSSSSKSHSSITDPKVYIFDPHTRSIQKVSDTTVESTSLIACPQHGLVIGSSYGLDSNDQNTPVHLTTMTANPSVMQDRKTARTLRKLYSVTGDSVANDPDTWSESPAQTGLPTPNPADFDSNEAEWDAQES